jgi:hypothetical protein
MTYVMRLSCLAVGRIFFLFYGLDHIAAENWSDHNSVQFSTYVEGNIHFITLCVKSQAVYVSDKASVFNLTSNKMS